MVVLVVLIKENTKGTKPKCSLACEIIVPVSFFLSSKAVLLLVTMSDMLVLSCFYAQTFLEPFVHVSSKNKKKSCK